MYAVHEKVLAQLSAGEVKKTKKSTDKKSNLTVNKSRPSASGLLYAVGLFHLEATRHFSFILSPFSLAVYYAGTNKAQTEYKTGFLLLQWIAGTKCSRALQ